MGGLTGRRPVGRVVVGLYLHRPALPFQEGLTAFYTQAFSGDAVNLTG